MLSRAKRLNLKKDFSKIAKYGKRVYTPNLALIFIFEEKNLPQVGIAMKTADFKKAHDRNRARRLASAAVEKFYPYLRKGLNLVIMPKPGALKKTSEELLEELRHVKDIAAAD